MNNAHKLSENPDIGLVKSLNIAGATGGPLSGIDVVVKDLFDIEGEVNSFGNPDWADHVGPALAHAWIVSRLLEFGARITGKTTTVELAYGLEGSNIHYGTPINPASPDRLPGGSSCGSAVMVAGGHAQVGIGSDTGGSVRIPASYCGVYGIRPSQGIVSLAGAAAMAPGFDTPGWFARDAATMLRIGTALLPPSAPLMPEFLCIPEAFENADPEVVAALAPVLEKLGPMATISPVPEGLDKLLELQRDLRSRETWLTLNGFVKHKNPSLALITAARIAQAGDITNEAARRGWEAKQAYTSRMQTLLAGGAVFVVPTSPCPAPLRTADETTCDKVRTRTLRVGIISAFAGLPELTIPVGKVDGAPVGLSLIAGPGRDLALLKLAVDLSLA